ncbi:MAG: hypothetical protein SF123_12230 [Chloroflexota bacterium]|nr:hypothetical protein [Chloroflexota bacterium]
MKREAKLLLSKAISSLVISVDHFNASSSTGRAEAVLIFLDHAFEMLLKASIVERGGRIREKGAKNTIGFDHCIRKALTEGSIQFLTEDQALNLQIINNYRDAAQHYMLDISEQLLYTASQTGLTLFRAILKKVFGKELADYFPERVLPISTTPAIDMAELFHSEVEAIRVLLRPGKRQQTEALARLRPLAIMEEALQGQNQTPSDEQLGRLGKAIRKGKAWHEIFPGAASIQVTSTGYGPALEMHIVKKEGIPVQLVPEGTPNAGVIAVKRVNELDFYNLNLTELCDKVGLTQFKCLAVIWSLSLQSDSDCFKAIKIGSQTHKRYSQKTIGIIRNAIAQQSIDQICEAYKQAKPTGRRRKS